MRISDWSSDVCSFRSPCRPEIDDQRLAPEGGERHRLILRPEEGRRGRFLPRQAAIDAGDRRLFLRLILFALIASSQRERKESRDYQAHYNNQQTGGRPVLRRVARLHTADQSTG